MTLRPILDPDHPLFGDPIADDPDDLLFEFTQWLDQKGVLGDVEKAGLAEVLNDLGTRFMEDRRESRVLDRGWCGTGL